MTIPHFWWNGEWCMASGGSHIGIFKDDFFKEQVPLESVRSLFSRIKFFRCFFCFSSVLDMLLCDVFLECRIDGFSTGQKKSKRLLTWHGTCWKHIHKVRPPKLRNREMLTHIKWFSKVIVIFFSHEIDDDSQLIVGDYSWFIND